MFSERKTLSPEYIQEVYSKSKLLYSKNDIEAALDRMAIEISLRVADKNPIFLCVVLGGIVTLGNLLPRLDFPLELDYIHLTRYGDKCSGDSEITWKAKPSNDLRGRTVVVVDDILDEGLTLAEVIKYCKECGAKDVLSAVLLNKEKKRLDRGTESADIVGLEVGGEHYVIGYGLDYKGYLRNVPGIYAVSPEHY